MKIKDIDLKHFNIVLKKKRVGFTLGTISIKSEPNFTSFYSGVKLNYEFGTELVFEKIGINQEIKIADLTDKQQISIKQSIVAKLNRAIKLQKKSASKTPVKVITNKDEFDFSEFDELDNEPIPMLTDFANKEVIAVSNGKIDDFDDFDFSELDINDKGVTEEVVVTADFDFDEPDVKPETNIETLIKESDFDFDDDDVLVTTAPKKTIKDVVTNYNLKDDLSNEEEIMKTLPYFYLLHRGYRITIDFNRKTFSASGDNQKIVNSLHHLATLIFINYDFLTSEKHPEWLYSGLKDDVTAIFEKIVNLNHDTLTGMEESIGIIESGIYSALLNYRNILGYFNHHKPLAIEHE